MRTIILSPEGQGKSTDIIRKVVVESQSKKNMVIFSSHTIANSIEKFKYAKSNFNLKDKMFRLQSDSELFRDMISLKSKGISDLFNTSTTLKEKYINHSLLSYDSNTKEFCHLHKNTGDVTKLKASLKHSNSPEDYNASVANLLYNTLTNIEGKFDYYLAIEMTDNKPDIDNMIPAFKSSFVNNATNLNNINDSLENAEVICIPGSYIKKYHHNKIDRDASIKNTILEHNDCIIFAQSKIVENLLIPYLKKLELIDETHLIMDEVLDSDFILDNFSLVKGQLDVIFKKISNSGLTSLNNRDVMKLKDLNIYDAIAKICKKNSEEFELNIDTVKMVATSQGTSTFIGEPRFCSRLTEFNHTTVLTSEKFKSEILNNALDYTILESESGYSYDDSLFDIYQTNTNTKLKIRKSDEASVSKFGKLLKEEYVRSDNCMLLGTSYFDTDMSLAACRGRNLSENIKKLVILTNQNSPSLINKYIAFVNKFYATPPSSIRKYVSLHLRIDELNQSIGRISGYRRKRFPNTTIELFYYSRDKYAQAAISHLRYKGNIITNSSVIDKKVDDLVSKHQVIKQEYTRLYNTLQITSDKHHVHDVKSEAPRIYNLDYIRTKLGMTYRGVVEKLIPNIFKMIHVDASKSKGLLYLSSDLYFSNFVNDRDRFYKNGRNIDLENNSVTPVNEDAALDILNTCKLLSDGNTSTLDTKLSVDSNVDKKLFLVSNFYTYLFKKYKKITNEKYTTELINLQGKHDLIYHNMHTIPSMDKIVKLKNSLDVGNRVEKFESINMTILPKKFDIDIDVMSHSKKLTKSEVFLIKHACIAEYLWSTQKTKFSSKLNKAGILSKDDYAWFNTMTTVDLWKTVPNVIAKKVLNYVKHNIRSDEWISWFRANVHRSGVEASIQIKSENGTRTKTIRGLNVTHYNPLKMYKDILVGKMDSLKDTILNSYNNVSTDNISAIHKLLSKDHTTLFKTCGLDPNKYYMIKSGPKKQETDAVVDYITVTSSVPTNEHRVGQLVNANIIKSHTSTTSNQQLLGLDPKELQTASTYHSYS